MIGPGPLRAGRGLFLGAAGVAGRTERARAGTLGRVPPGSAERSNKGKGRPGGRPFVLDWRRRYFALACSTSTSDPSAVACSGMTRYQYDVAGVVVVSENVVPVWLGTIVVYVPGE
jgi:hypothetical protein